MKTLVKVMAVTYYLFLLPRDILAAATFPKLGKKPGKFRKYFVRNISPKLFEISILFCEI